jgi:hypothetical protein
MTSLTTNKSLIKPGHNEYVDEWDTPVNENSDSIDACLGNVTIINMTSLSTYTLTATDVLCTTLKFTGTLNSGVIPILMPLGAGGQFTMIDATTATDATSQLSFGWVGGGGTSVRLSQGGTQPLTADGVNSIWSTAAAQTVPGVTYFNLTGVTGTTVIPEDKCRNKTWVFYGTLANSIVSLEFPQSQAGVYAQAHIWTAAGGSSNLVLTVTGTSGGSTIAIAENTRFMAAYYRPNPTSNAWIWARMSAAT